MHVHFSLGRVFITRGALGVLSHLDVLTALRRHVQGDWGSLCEEDRALNDEAAQVGSRILSAYESSCGEPFWIITEADRSSTTILLPSEY